MGALKRKQNPHDEGEADKRSRRATIDRPVKPLPEDVAPADSLDEPGRNLNDAKTPVSFQDLGIIDELCDATVQLGFKHPTPIQEQSIPVALEGRDIIGIAETGSGKTAAFALPMLQALLKKPQPLFGLVLAPTRELAYQTAQQIEALGALIAVKTAVVVGGMNMVDQQIALAKNPHIVVAAPGRLLDHMENTKGFNLRKLQYLVMDEADKLLDQDFGPILDKILARLPVEGRHTYLFSATLSSKVQGLTRASLRNPVKVEVSNDGNGEQAGSGPRQRTVSQLLQSFKFIPIMHKDHYLVALLTGPFAGRTTIVFGRTVHEVARLTLLLRALNVGAIPLHGQLTQSSRLAALNKFKARSRDVLVATDVAARGLDIPSVDLVVNYDLPGDSTTYVHRVGRTARAGRSGHALSLVSQYDIEVWQRIEKFLGRQVEEYNGVTKDEAMVHAESISAAQREAITKLREDQKNKDRKHKKRAFARSSGRTGKRDRGQMDAEEG